MSRLVRVIRVSRRLDSVSLAILTGLAALLGAQPALACSVCFGDPSSGLSQGAQAGMLVLLGEIVVVLIALWLLDAQGCQTPGARGSWAGCDG